MKADGGFPHILVRRNFWELQSVMAMSVQCQQSAWIYRMAWCKEFFFFWHRIRDLGKFP